jgi:hypothetical protein
MGSFLLDPQRLSMQVAAKKITERSKCIRPEASNYAAQSSLSRV